MTKDKFNWDREENPDIILYRRMKWDDPLALLRENTNERLKNIFFRFYHKWDSKNLNFWKNILEITDEEIEQKANKRFKRINRIGNF